MTKPTTATVMPERTLSRYLEDARWHLAFAIGCLKQASYAASPARKVLINRLVMGLAGTRRVIAALRKDQA